MKKTSKRYLLKKTFTTFHFTPCPLKTVLSALSSRTNWFSECTSHLCKAFIKTMQRSLACPFQFPHGSPPPNSFFADWERFWSTPVQSGERPRGMLALESSSDPPRCRMAVWYHTYPYNVHSHASFNTWRWWWQRSWWVRMKQRWVKVFQFRNPVSSAEKLVDLFLMSLPYLALSLSLEPVCGVRWKTQRRLSKTLQLATSW